MTPRGYRVRESVMTRGERAAIAYLRKLVPARVLASLQQLGNDSYRNVLVACRKDLGLPEDRGDDALRRNVVEAVPEEHRAALEEPLQELMDAEFDRRRVAERAAYLIGLVTRGGLGSRSVRRWKGSPSVSRNVMTPRDAAQRFVALVLRITFDDMLDLADPHDGNFPDTARAQKAAYAQVETAVRHRLDVTHDLDALETDLLAAASGRPDDVASAVSKLMFAVYDELTVKQQAGYTVGIAVGRALHASAASEIGEGWSASTP
jgi:hypothetical protein